MKNLLNSIKLTKPQSNVFDLTHDVKLSCNMGQLVPIMCLETVPGDKFNISCESLLRFAPLVSPVMHRMDVTMHYYFVPNRIIWPNWEKFITNTDLTPGNLPAFPFIEINSAQYTELADYLGIPNPVGLEMEEVSALPFAAYQCIYNEYYRDQNLIDPIDYVVSDGDNFANIMNLLPMRKRAWEHDYFTAALPFAQKGNAVELPLGDFQDVPVRVNMDNIPAGATTLEGTPHDVPIAGDFPDNSMPSDDIFAETSLLTPTATTINDLRRAFRLQEWLEKAARGGSRYVENILAHFGVKSSDKRLQRPEYITGTKSPVQISEVLNTTGTVDAPQGTQAGHAISVTSGKYGNYYCEEHGYIIGIMSIMPKTAYQQGIPKHFIKTTDPFQYYWPSFAHIGEQEVLNKEIYAFQGGTGEVPFGYVPRYAEYKFQPSRVAGDFRNTLDFWHLGRIFDAPPALNQEFIEVDSQTTDRIFAVTDPEDQKLYCHVLNKVRAVRPMPKFGTPTF